MGFDNLSNDEVTSLGFAAIDELKSRLNDKLSDQPSVELPKAVAALTPWEPVPESILRKERELNTRNLRDISFFDTENEPEEELVVMRRLRVVIDGQSVAWLADQQGKND